MTNDLLFLVVGHLQQTQHRSDLGSSDSSNTRKHVTSGESPSSAAAGEQRRVDAGGAKMADGPPVQQVRWDDDTGLIHTRAPLTSGLLCHLNWKSDNRGLFLD